MAVALSDLMGVLQRSGAKFGDSSAMTAMLPNLKDAISSQVPANQALAQKKQQYRQQLDRIAQMDQKLSGAYSKPESNLYIENPMSRERLLSGASNVGYKALSDVGSEVKQASSDIDKQTNEALSLYKELAREQSKAEKAKKKETKAKASSKVSAITNKITDKARIYEKGAIKKFLTSPQAFQESWIEKIMSQPVVFPKGGYTSGDITEELKKWRKVETGGITSGTPDDIVNIFR